MRTLGAVTLLSLLLGGVVACTGGGTGGTGSPVTAAAVSEGSITEIGSIWVNGVEYDTTGATVVMDGTEFEDTSGDSGGTELMPGMVVRVEGSINPDGLTGRAVRVTYRNILQGPVEGAPTADSAGFRLLGQDVVVDPGLTRFQGIADSDNDDQPDIGGLKNGDVVEVSGFIGPNGAIHATYLESKPSETGFELVGRVTSVLSNYRFTMGTLTIDTEGIGRDVTGLAGLLVEVKGKALSSTGLLTADSIEVETGLLHSGDIDEAALQGLVTSVGAGGYDLVLNGQPVNFSSGTEFNGGDQAAIVPGIWLKVEGTIRDGVLVAEEVSFEDAIELKAPVALVNATSLILQGLVRTGDATPLEVTVRDGVTAYEGDLISGLSGISEGDLVEVRARESGGTLLATKISVQGPAELPATIALQGPVDSTQSLEPDVSLLGINIDTSKLAITDEYDQPLTSSDLFSALRSNPDAVIEVEGTWAGGTAATLWQTLELDE